VVSCSGTPPHLARRSPGIEPATFRLPDNRSYLLSYCCPWRVCKDFGLIIQNDMVITTCFVLVPRRRRSSGRWRWACGWWPRAPRLPVVPPPAPRAWSGRRPVPSSWLPSGAGRSRGSRRPRASTPWWVAPCGLSG